MKLSYDSPCACEIIHEAVTLRYASIKHHLQPARARIERVGEEKMGGERKYIGRRQEIEDGGERGTKEGYGYGYSNRW